MSCVRTRAVIQSSDQPTARQPASQTDQSSNQKSTSGGSRVWHSVWGTYRLSGWADMVKPGQGKEEGAIFPCPTGGRLGGPFGAKRERRDRNAKRGPILGPIPSLTRTPDSPSGFCCFSGHPCQSCPCDWPMQITSHGQSDGANNMTAGQSAAHLASRMRRQQANKIATASLMGSRIMD